MASYIDDASSINVIPGQFQRRATSPLDRSSIFLSYDDAVEYAKGLYKADGERRASAHDTRKLAGTSYIGQIISVYENNVVTVYKINPPDQVTGFSALERLGGGTVDCGEYI